MMAEWKWELDAMAEFMNALPFVRWDRCAGDDDSRVAYGWIARDDGRADFVLLTFDQRGIGFTTSSATYSEQIRDIIYSGVENLPPHGACERVVDMFGERVGRAVGR